jgi:hypothetical protein
MQRQIPEEPNPHSKILAAKISLEHWKQVSFAQRQIPLTSSVIVGSSVTKFEAQSKQTFCYRSSYIHDGQTLLLIRKGKLGDTQDLQSYSQHINNRKQTEGSKTCIQFGDGKFENEKVCGLRVVLM